MRYALALVVMVMACHARDGDIEAAQQTVGAMLTEMGVSAPVHCAGVKDSIKCSAATRTRVLQFECEVCFEGRCVFVKSEDL